MTPASHARALDGVSAALRGPEWLSRERRLALAAVVQRASAALDAMDNLPASPSPMPVDEGPPRAPGAVTMGDADLSWCAEYHVQPCVMCQSPVTELREPARADGTLCQQGATAGSPGVTEGETT